MSNKPKKVREPLFHIAKRNGMPPLQAWLIRLASIVAALIVSALVIVVLTKENPIEVYASMIKGSFGTSRKFWILLQNIAILLCIALAVTPAFKMKFWNLGAEGQVLVGGLASVACMFYVGDKLPNWLLLVVMLVVSVLSGIIWGLIPAYFKSKFGTNESLFTLMMNYIAMQLVTFFINIWVPNGSNVMGLVNSDTKAGWIPDIFGQKYLFNIIIVAVLTIVMFIYLKYSKHGYELSVVGESVNTAKYCGINVKKVIIRTMALSGAICGLAGYLLVAGTNHTISKDLAGGNGFTAIMVSWLAKFNPIIMVVSSFLIVFLQRGASQIATEFRLNESVADILTGIIIFFLIGSEFFINYQIKRTSTNKEDK